MKKILIVGLLCLTGCVSSTTPISASSAKGVPTDRLRAYQEQSSPDDATLIVTRDVGRAGSGCYSGFMINGKLAARFDVGETARFHVPPGELLLKNGVDPEGRGLCGVPEHHWTVRETIMKPGDRKYFRLSYSPGGTSDVQRTVD